jgi:glutathione S-transferase
VTLQLYDLAGADDALRFSPNCWRTRLALAHKGLDVETIPWRFTETHRLAFSGQGKVPILVHDGRSVHDSWTIALYLEETWPDRPSLFGGAAGLALARFMNHWADNVVQAGLVRMIVADIVHCLHPKDRDYFRTSREARFGATLESVGADRDQRIGAFRQSLQPLRLTVQERPFLGGDRPLYADYVAFGGFQWARTVSSFAVLDDSDPVAAWRDRMLDLYGGLARGVPARAA